MTTVRVAATARRLKSNWRAAVHVAAREHLLRARRPVVERARAEQLLPAARFAVGLKASRSCASSTARGRAQRRQHRARRVLARVCPRRTRAGTRRAAAGARPGRARRQRTARRARVCGPAVRERERVVTADDEPATRGTRAPHAARANAHVGGPRSAPGCGARAPRRYDAPTTARPSAASRARSAACDSQSPLRNTPPCAYTTPAHGAPEAGQYTRASTAPSRIEIVAARTRAALAAPTRRTTRPRARAAARGGAATARGPRRRGPPRCSSRGNGVRSAAERPNVKTTTWMEQFFNPNQG